MAPFPLILACTHFPPPPAPPVDCKLFGAQNCPFTPHETLVLFPSTAVLSLPNKRHTRRTNNGPPSSFPPLARKAWLWLPGCKNAGTAGWGERSGAGMASVLRLAWEREKGEALLEGPTHTFAASKAHLDQAHSIWLSCPPR